MALTKEKKQSIVNETALLLNEAKMTVLAIYPGTSVKAIQELRKEAQVDGTRIKIIKNRLFNRALAGEPRFKQLDISHVTGQLLYAFNNDDEVAPAKSLAEFSKINPRMELVAAITAEGQLLSAEEVKHLATLPSKQQLRGLLVGLLQTPTSSLVNIFSANLRSAINVMAARAETLN